jgi:hypothetical protein
MATNWLPMMVKISLGRITVIGALSILVSPGWRRHCLEETSIECSETLQAF